MTNPTLLRQRFNKVDIQRAIENEENGNAIRDEKRHLTLKDIDGIDVILDSDMIPYFQEQCAYLKKEHRLTSMKLSGCVEVELTYASHVNPNNQVSGSSLRTSLNITDCGARVSVEFNDEYRGFIGIADIIQIDFGDFA